VKILLTGGLGFIGKKLFERLRAEGHSVLAIDLHVRDYEDYVRGDITHFEELYRIFKNANGFDLVIHAGGEVGRMIGEEHPQKMVYVNDVGTLNIIQLSLDYGSRLIYFSTSEVYGHLFEHKEVVEEDLDRLSPFELTNIYAISKFFGETLVRHYVLNYGLLAASVRPFMVYGPGVFPSKYKSALDQFVYNALQDKPLVVHRGSERAWCYVDDFVEGFICILNNHKMEPGRYEAFNVGTQEYISSEDLARKIVALAGKSEDLIQVIDPPGRFLSNRKRFSIDKLSSLGFKQQVGIEEGIMRVIEWMKSIPSNA
jgi:nucleoside-diphosphate-sugar epimerase